MEQDDNVIQESVAPVEAAPEEMSMFESITDKVSGLNNGIEEAITGFAGNIAKASEFINNTLNIPEVANIDADGDGEKDGWDVYGRDEFNQIVKDNDLKPKNPITTIADLDFVDEPETIGGQFISEASKFVTGFALTGPLFKSVGVIDDVAGGLANTMRTGAAKGLAVDIAVYDQTEANLAAFIKENKWAEGPVIDFLATNETDAASVNMLKRGLEGMAAGGVIDVALAGVVALARSVKAAAQNAKNGTPLTEVQIRELTEAEDILAKVREYEPDSIPANVPKVDTAPEAPTVTDVKPEAPKAPTVTDEQVKLAQDFDARLGKEPNAQDLEGLDIVPARPAETDVKPDAPEIAPLDSPKLDLDANIGKGVDVPPVKPEVVTETPTFANLVPDVGDAPVQKGAITRLTKSPVPHIDSVVLRERIMEAAQREPKVVDLSGKLDLVELDIPFNPKFFVNRTPDVIIQEAHQIFKDEGVHKALGLDNPQTHDAVVAKSNQMLQEAMGGKFTSLKKNLALAAKMTQDQAALIVTGKKLVEGLATKIKNDATILAKKVEDGITDEALELEIVRNTELMMDLFASTKSIQTAGARATAAGKITNGEVLNEDVIQKLAVMGGSGNIRDIAQKIAALKDPIVIARTLSEATHKNKLVGITNELFINNILSGYRTFFVNLKGNLLHNAILPVERMAGGAIMNTKGRFAKNDALRQKGSDEFYEGLYHYQYARTHALQSLRMAARSFKKGSVILDSTLQNDLAQSGKKFIQASDDYATRHPMMGAVINGMGTVIRSPTERMLAPTDEFFKQFTFRNRSHAILSVEAHKLSPADLEAQGFESAQQWVTAKMANTVHTRKTLESKYKRLVKEGRVSDDLETMKAYIEKNIGKANLDDATAQRALREAQIGTGTAPLAKGTWGHSIQTVLNNHPIGRQFVPFIQTPVNLLNYGLKRFPGAQYLSKKLRSELTSNNPDIQAEAYGRVATSTALLTTAIYMHMEGNLTGGGPADWQERKQAQDGPSWQPYSMRAGDTWYAYNRDDPVFTPLGIMADMIEATQYVDFMDKDGGGLLGSNFNPKIDPDFYAALMLSVANNVTSKSFMQSLVDLADMISSKDERELSKFMKTRAGALVPLSGMGGNINAALDPYQRELQTVMDHVWSKVPGQSGGLPVKYDWLSGKALMKPKYTFGTMTKNTSGKDKVWVEVDQEIMRLGTKFQGAPRSVNGLKLDAKSIQMINYNMGNFRRTDGMYLMDALNARMKQDDYKKMGPYKFHDRKEDPRIQALDAIISDFREYGTNVFKKENPGLFFGPESKAAKYAKYLITGLEDDVEENDLTRLDRDFLDTLRK